MDNDGAPQNGNGTSQPPAASGTIEINEQIRQAGQAERDRVRHIMSLGAAWNAQEEARAAVDNSQPLSDFMQWVLENRTNAQPAAPITSLGLSAKENRQFSIVKALRELSDTNGPRVLTGLEAEASAAMGKLLKRETGGFFLPPELMIPTRSMAMRDGLATPYVAPPWPTGGTTPPPTGGYLVQADYLPLIEFLRIWLVVRQAGARILTGLSGNIIIPKQTGATVCYWLNEAAPAVPPTDLGFTQIGLTPKRLAAHTVYSRQLMIQATPDIENLVRSDLAEVMAAEMDRAALWGTGVAPIPRGIIHQAGINRWEFADDPLYEGYVKGVVAIDDSRVNLTSGAWIMNPRCWGAAISTPKFPNTGNTVAQEGGSSVDISGRSNAMYSILGYPLYKTQNIPNVNLPAVPGLGQDYRPYAMTGGLVFFGNWSDLLIGQWSGVEIVADPYTQLHQALIRVVTLQFADLNVRHPEAFAVSEDDGYGSIVFRAATAETPPTNEKGEKGNHGEPLFPNKGK